VLENVDSRHKIICPAVMFAANRKLSVKGRTIILMDSIIIKNGFNHNGALSGNKCPVVFLVDSFRLLMINNIHRGRPRDSVITICLDGLNRYGRRPMMFI